MNTSWDLFHKILEKSTTSEPREYGHLSSLLITGDDWPKRHLPFSPKNAIMMT